MCNSYNNTRQSAHTNENPGNHIVSLPADEHFNETEAGEFYADTLLRASFRTPEKFIGYTRRQQSDNCIEWLRSAIHYSIKCSDLTSLAAPGIVGGTQ